MVQVTPAAILDALSEPAAAMADGALAVNAAWTAQGLPSGADAVHATFIAAPRAGVRARFETAWRLADIETTREDV